MKTMDLQGIICGKPHKIAVTDEETTPVDNFNRPFKVPAPTSLWILDFTYTGIRKGSVYVAFVIDAFTCCIGRRRISSSTRSGSALDALELVAHKLVS
jgi:transposase InsO family protein